MRAQLSLPKLKLCESAYTRVHPLKSRPIIDTDHSRLLELDPAPGSLVLIENVGNLVCPAAFDLGEAHKVAILSITEGEDKPIKYPDMFAAADVMLLNKIDLLPYLDFDVDRCIEFARRIHPSIQIIQVSAKTGEGMSQWYQWLSLNRQGRLIGHPVFAHDTRTEEDTRHA